MTATGLAARDPQISHKLTFDGPMSPAAASKSVTSTKWRHSTMKSHDFYEILFIYDIVSGLVVYTCMQMINRTPLSTIHEKNEIEGPPACVST